MTLIILSVLFLLPYSHYFQNITFEDNISGDAIEISFLNTKSNFEASVAYTRYALKRDMKVITYAQVTPEARDAINKNKPDDWNSEFKIYPGIFGIGLLTKYPINEFDYLHEMIDKAPFGGKNPWVQANIIFKGTEVEIGVIHPPRPTSKNLFKVRNNLLSFLSDPGNKNKFPDIVIGDFNVSPGSPYFRKLIQNEHWNDANHSNPIRATWPTGIPFMGLPIDHMIYNSSFEWANSKVGSTFGSDHASIYGELSKR